MASSWRCNDVPNSLMLKTPLTALELALRCLGSVFGGLDERPCTAESTLVRGAGPASADIVGREEGIT